MIAAGIGWITQSACGAYGKPAREFSCFKSLYQDFQKTGIFAQPADKVRWLNTISARYCFAAALALNGRILAPETASLSVSRDGALQPNLDYFKDYIQSGRKLARGNLFIHTLPTSTIAETAIAFGLKGPVLHLSAANPSLNLIFDRAAAICKEPAMDGALCFAAGDKAVICFHLQNAEVQRGGMTLASLKSRIGGLWKLETIFESLQIPFTGILPVRA